MTVKKEIGLLSNWRPKSENDSVLDGYLKRLRASFFSNDILYTEQVWERFRGNLTRHFSRLSDFLVEPNSFLQNLVLGHVQSGKTGHLMANIAWAHDKKFDLVILLNGNKNTLSTQTARRVEKDLRGSIGLHFVQTEANKAFDDYVQELGAAISLRRTRDGSPLPIAVLIKNGSRVDGLREGLLKFQDIRTSPLRVLVLDDEADQVSPDASTSNRSAEQSRRSVHSALKDLSESVHGKVIYLSYTATPQALFHQDRDALHQPRYCSIVPAGPSYFGLEQLLETPGVLGNYDDLLAAENGENVTEMQTGLLEKLLVEFLVTAWLHNSRRTEFHSSGTACTKKSVQMLIHPSGNQQDHRVFAEHVAQLREHLIEVLNSDEAREDLINKVIEPIFLSVMERAQIAELTEVEAHECLTFIFEIIRDKSDLKIRIVNSDERFRLASTGQDAEFLPADDDEWDNATAWVLVGGDILGRGLTIPHLVSTLFIRNPKSPNFDTSVQQMRFCGYRMDYRRLLRVVAPVEILQDYVDADSVDQDLRTEAEMWDETGRDLFNYPPKIVHMTPSGSRLKATRKTVISPGITKVLSSSSDGVLQIVGHKNLGSFQRATLELHEFLVANFPHAEVNRTTGFLQISATPEQLLTLIQVAWPDQFNENAIILLQELSERRSGPEAVLGKRVTVIFDLGRGLDSFSAISKSTEMLLNRPLSLKPESMRFRSLLSTTNLKASTDWRQPNASYNIAVKALVGQSERDIRKGHEMESLLLIRPIALTNNKLEAVALSLSGVFWLPADSPDFFLHAGA